MILGFFKGNISRKADIFSGIKISKRAVILPARVIQTSNISRVTSYDLHISNSIRFLLFIISYLLVIAFMLTYYIKIKPFGMLGYWELLIMSLLFFVSFIVSMLYTKHGVQIQTDGATSDMLITEDKESADILYDKIIDSIEKIKEGMVIEINKKMEINHSTIQGNITMENSFDNVETVSFNENG